MCESMLLKISIIARLEGGVVSKPFFMVKSDVYASLQLPIHSLPDFEHHCGSKQRIMMDTNITQTNRCYFLSSPNWKPQSFFCEGSELSLGHESFHCKNLLRLNWLEMVLKIHQKAVVSRRRQ